MEKTTKSVKLLLKDFIKGPVREFYWRIYGHNIQNPGLPDSPKSFLFICKGNICRSPFAEHLAVRMAEKRNITGTAFYSAGLEVSQSLPSPHEAVLTAKRFGISLHEHKSRSIDNGIVNLYDMIIAMDMTQFNYLRKSFPHSKYKIFLLPLFEKKISPKDTFLFYNILDPYGRSVEEFLACYQRIEGCLDGLLTEVVAQKQMLAS